MKLQYLLWFWYITGPLDGEDYCNDWCCRLSDLHLASTKAAFRHILTIRATLYINSHKTQMTDDSICADMAYFALSD
jgi:hypothetical protein